jgi:amino-acid N-acetyltransferase
MVMDDTSTAGGHVSAGTIAEPFGFATNETVGLQTPAEVVIEKARASDADDIHAVVTYFADRGDMLHRPLSEVYETLRDFYVARVDGAFAGCAALHLWWSNLAEIKSLAVREDRQLKGVGFRLVSACLDEARRLGLDQVFALTYKPGFFEKLGFHVANVAEFPRKVWNECYRCPKFANCNEIAVAVDLGAAVGKPPNA